MNETMLMDSRTTFERREHVLLAYYDRLKQIDEGNRDLTSFFFAINTAILAVVFQLFSPGWQRLILAFVGYTAAVALMLIGFKSYWAWKAYARDMRKLEDKLGYGISQKYEEQLRANEPARTIQVTLVRLRFNFLFTLLFFLLMIYCVFTNPSPLHFTHSSLYVISDVLIIAIIGPIPWIGLSGALRLGVVWATLRVLWTQEI